MILHTKEIRNDHTRNHHINTRSYPPDITRTDEVFIIMSTTVTRQQHLNVRSKHGVISPRESKELAAMTGYTRTQIRRWYNVLWAHMTEGDGYQPFGYDMVTLKMTRPGYVRAMRRLNEMYKGAIQ